MKSTIVKFKKHIILIAISILFFIASIISVMPIMAHASEGSENSQNEQIYEQLTTSDVLSGLDMTIDEYFSNIKSEYYVQTTNSANPYERIYEHTEHISKIIPIDLFKEICEEHYSGAEYLFYIKTYDTTTSRRSSVLIIDYDFVYLSQEQEASLRLTMFEQDYEYFLDEGKDVVFPVSGNYNEFSIFNPELFGVVNNKYSLNSFDSGYRKEHDNGIIFRQTRLNYHGAYQEVDYSWQEVNSFIVDKGLGIIADYFDVGVVLDAIDLIDAIVSGVETTECEVTANNETNITNFYTKQNQINDSSFTNLTKAVKVKPKAGTFINDYIELKVVLSEDEEPTELTLGAVFDIRIEDHMTGEITMLSNEKEEEREYVVFDKNLFDRIYDFAEVNNFIYVLPNNKQIVKFDPPFNADYQFSHNFSLLKIYKNYDLNNLLGNNEVASLNSAYSLTNSYPYYLEINNETAESVYGGLSENIIATTLIEGNNDINVSTVKPTIYKLTGDKRIVTIQTDINVLLECYDDSYTLVDCIKNGVEYIIPKNDGVMYVLFVNATDEYINTSVQMQNNETISRGETITIEAQSEKYYEFIPDSTADYIFNSANGVNCSVIERNESSGKYRLEKDESYFIYVFNESLASTTFLIDFYAETVNLGENTNLTSTDIGVYRIEIPKSMEYTITSSNIISCVYKNNIKDVYNTYDVHEQYSEGTILYIILENVSFNTKLNISVDYAETLTLGEEFLLQSNGKEYLVAKFIVSENSYYGISSGREFELFNEGLVQYSNAECRYLTSGIYYIKINFNGGNSTSLIVKKLSQRIYPHTHYTIDETTYYFVELDQNKSYNIETLGEDDYNVSTSIKVYNGDGSSLLADETFEKYGCVLLNTNSRSQFNIIVTSTAQTPFVFRIVYASSDDVGSNKAIVDIGEPIEVQCNSYMEISYSSSVELYIALPNISSSLTLFEFCELDEQYVALMPENTQGNYKKYSFKISNERTILLYLQGDYTDELVIVLLPMENLNDETNLCENDSIIVKNAQNEIVNSLLYGNTYSFEWLCGDIYIPSSMLGFQFEINNSEHETSNIRFAESSIGTSINIRFQLFDRSIEKSFVLVRAFDIGEISLGIETFTGENKDLHFALLSPIINNGSDGTITVENKKVYVYQNGSEIASKQFSAAELSASFDLYPYQWMTNLSFKVELSFNDGTKIYQYLNHNVNKNLFNSSYTISTNEKVVYFYGGSNVNINKNIDVPANVIMLNIEGNSSYTYNKLSFSIARRTTPLIININNLKFNSYTDSLLAYSCFGASSFDSTCFVMNMLGINSFTGSTAYMNEGVLEFYNHELYILGNGSTRLTINGADGDIADVGEYGRTGGCGITAETLYIENFLDITIYGGDGSMGGIGEAGKDAPDYTYIGYNGYMGEDGGNGNHAIFCDYLFVNKVNQFYAKGGNGGEGGQGGTGGAGAHGWNNPNANGGSGGDGSQGGHGGHGGYGGNGADAVYVFRDASINQDTVNFTFVGGDAGKAGKGGTGGRGGDGGTGARGKDGWFNNNDGGKGGNGGNGGDGGDGGRVGTAGYGLYEAGTRSEIQGNLYNSTTYLNAAKGVGGAGGSGGTGGNGGDGFLGNGSAGASGATGAAGAQGDAGFTG